MSPSAADQDDLRATQLTRVSKGRYNQCHHHTASDVKPVPCDEKILLADRPKTRPQDTRQVKQVV